MSEDGCSNGLESQDTEKREDPFNYDVILEHIGPMGKFSLRICLLLMIPNFFPGVSVMSGTFTGFVPDYQCRVEGCNNTYSPWLSSNYSNKNACYRYNATVTDLDIKCSQVNIDVDDINSLDTCDQWMYDTSMFKSTIVSDFDLTCNDEEKIALSNSIYMAGMLAGSFILGILADKFGRRRTFVINCFLNGISMTVTAFSPNYTAYFIFRFLTGLTAMGQYIIAYVWGVEATGKKHRVFVGVLYQAAYGLGSCVMGLAAYFERDWRTLQLIVGVPMFLPMILFWVLPESTRWLITMKRYDEAKKLTNRAAEMNKKSVPEHLLVIPDEEENKNQNTTETSTTSENNDCENLNDKTVKTEGIIDLFRTPVILLRIITLCTAWVSVSMSYYGISFSASNLTGDFFLNYELLMIVEIPAHVGSIISLEKLGRRFTLSASLLISGLACLATGLLPNDPAAYQVVFSLLGKLFATMAFDSAFGYTAELFPTHSRSFTTGLCSTLGRVGSILAPIITDIGRKHNAGLPFIIFSVLSVVSGLFCLSLPETNNLPLPSNIQEAKDLNKHTLPCFRCSQSKD